MDLSDSSPNSSSLHQSSTADVNTKNNKRKASNDAVSIVRHFGIADILEDIDAGRYGNVDKDMEDLYESRMAALQPFYKVIPESTDGSCKFINDASDGKKPFNNLGDGFVELKSKSSEPTQKMIIIDLDEEEDGAQMPVQPHQDVLIKKCCTKVSKVSAHGGASQSDYRNIKKDNVIHVHGDDNDVHVDDDLTEKNKMPCIVPETCIDKDKGTYIGVDDDLADEMDQPHCNNNDDGLDYLWQEMTYAQELCKDDSVNPPPDEHVTDDEEDCEHSLILQDDIGYVCRICGIIKKAIGSIIEYQYAKKKSTRTYKYEGIFERDVEDIDILAGEMRSSGHDFVATKIFIHPRHSKIMKPHQVEGFNFLARNLVDDNPGGCILAHAPGSGKTLMIISFIQSFMAKYPSARPLVVLPKGILPTWKKEFLLWQVDNIPLLDFYSVNANSRSQQLEVLEQWVKTRSILFLGYVQFSSIVCDPNTNETTAACEKILLKQPSILIMDEGHTPRTENTDQLAALERVETPRKVVLSGTLYQNHVKEVFNILNLVRPRFLKMEACKNPKKRILSIIETRKKGNLLKKSDNEFYEMVEESLLRDGDLKRKALIIQGLREMTDKVLHYYKGDSLDELPGLVDFTVFINLSPRQKREVEELKKLGGRFKMSSDGGSIYVHPQLKDLLKNTSSSEVLRKINREN